MLFAGFQQMKLSHYWLHPLTSVAAQGWEVKVGEKTAALRHDIQNSGEARPLPCFRVADPCSTSSHCLYRYTTRLLAWPPAVRGRHELAFVLCVAFLRLPGASLVLH